MRLHGLTALLQRLVRCRAHVSCRCRVRSCIFLGEGLLWQLAGCLINLIKQLVMTVSMLLAPRRMKQPIPALIFKQPACFLAHQKKRNAS